MKQKLKSGQVTKFSDKKVRTSLYRPFTKSNLYFDRMMTERVYVFPSIFPTPETEEENRVICVGVYGRKAFSVMMSESVSDVNLYADPQQSFPFYTYNEDGTNRRENITDWALTEFRTHYQDDTITKWDIFHYNYGLLHHPDYREKYEANLKRDLPHIPFAEDFRGFRRSRRATRRYPRQLRIPTRIRQTQVHSEPGYATRLARREDETLQRQNPNRIQQFSHN